MTVSRRPLSPEPRAQPCPAAFRRPSVLLFACIFASFAFAVAACAGAGSQPETTSANDSGASADATAPSSSDATSSDAAPFDGASSADAAPADSAADVAAADGGLSDSGATALYAAPAGSGTSCALAAPCALDEAVNVARGYLPGMTGDVVVYLRGGTYRRSATLAFGPADSGQNGHRVAYQAYPGETPVVSGAVQVTGFTQYDATKNIWRAAVPSGATGRQLFVDGVRAVRARTAGSPDTVTATATGFDTSDGVFASYGNQSSIEVVQDSDWKHLRCPLQSITGLADGGASLNVLPSCWAANNLSVPNLAFPLNGSGLPAMSGISWVENAYELLTQPGQFYLDSAAGYLYYIPRAGEDLGTADVELPVLETLVSLNGTPGHLAPQNDTDPAATYTGSWQHYTNRGYGDLGDDVHATATNGDSVTFTFTGTGLQVLGETNTDEGTFEVYVDGTLDTTQPFTEASASRVAQQVIYSVSGLSSGSHTVKVVNAATGSQYTVIDGFLVVPSAIAPVHDVAFSGITFSYATWSLPSAVGYIDNQAGVLWDTSGTTTAATRIPAAVQVHRGLAVSFQEDVFSHLGGAALDLADGTQNASVTGCVIRDTSGGGVSIGEVDDYFQNQTSLMTSGDSIVDDAIANVGIDYHDAVGIWAGYTRAVTIEHNDIGHTPYSGMSLGWGWGWASSCATQSKEGLSSCRLGTIYAGGNQILDNYVHDVMGYLFDGGPIYTNGGQGDGNGSATSVLAGNFVTAGNHTNNMLYQDEGSSYWDTHDNVTSLGGADWIGMWTPTIHDITVGPVNYTDNANTLNNGTNITFTAPTIVTGGAWPSAAISIMTAAGLEPAYRPAATMLDDDDQSLTYTGSWAAQGFRGLGDYEDNVHYTATNGDSVSLAFTGTGVSFIGEKSSDQGQIAWSIDGQSQGLVDTSLPSGSPRQSQQVLFTSATLTGGHHVVQVTKSSGTYMTVDAFRVQP
jgi:hypothetical protein